MKRVLVCGGRNYDDRPHFWQFMNRIRREVGFSCIIEGGADGADKLARGYAKYHAIVSLTFEAEWKIHGRSAGPIRNRRMLKEGKPDLVIAFPGRDGTRDMVEQARRAGVEVMEVEP